MNAVLRGSLTCIAALLPYVAGLIKSGYKVDMQERRYGLR